MDMDALNLPDTTPAFVVLWAIGVFVAWYVYRHNPYFSRGKLIGTASVLTAFLFSVLLYYWYRNHPPAEPTRIAVFPLVDETAGRQQISALSLLVADAALAPLPHKEGDVLPYKLDWLREAVQVDSLTDPGYVRRTSRALKVDYAFWGSIQEAVRNGEELDISWVMYEAGARGTPKRWQSKASLRSLSQIAVELERRVPTAMLNDGVTRAQYDRISENQLRRYAGALYARWHGRSAQALVEAAMAVGTDSSFVPAMLLRAGTLIDSAGVLHSKGLEEESYPLFRDAKQLLLKTLQTDSTNALGYQELGRMYIWNERWTDAERYLLRSQAADWWQPHLYLHVSRLHPTRYVDFGVADEQRLYERAIFIYPGCLEAYLALADFYEFRHHWKRSIRELQRYLRINPNSVDALMTVGRLYVNHYDLLDILKLYQRILDLDPGNADAYYNLGVAYYNRDDLDTAEEFFQKAIRVRDHLNSHLYLAMIYSKRGEKEKAVSQLRYRLKHREGREDAYAEEARKMLFEILNPSDSSTVRSQQ